MKNMVQKYTKYIVPMLYIQIFATFSKILDIFRDCTVKFFAQEVQYYKKNETPKHNL